MVPKKYGEPVAKKEEKMAAGCKANARLLRKVAGIYDWLDLQIAEHRDLAGCCGSCGRCCDFAAFDHRLFVTVPERMYLAANVSPKEIKPMPAGRCPYNIAGKCTVYKYRFAGCRIFCCKGDKDFQSELSESAVKKFKSLCTELQIPYRYSDLATALVLAENTRDGRQRGTREDR